MRVILCRHGHVEGIEPARFRGRADIPLTARGHAEAAALAGRIAADYKPRAIYASPLARCMDTARAIGERIGVVVTPRSGLLDIDYGKWQWKTLQEASVDDPVLFSAWRGHPWLVRFPDGESLQDLLLRTADVIRSLVTKHLGESVVLVGHESVNRAILLQALDRPLSHYWNVMQAPCALNEIELSGNSARIVRLNDTSHLPPGN